MTESLEEYRSNMFFPLLLADGRMKKKNGKEKKQQQKQPILGFQSLTSNVTYQSEKR